MEPGTGFNQLPSFSDVTFILKEASNPTKRDAAGNEKLSDMIFLQFQTPEVVNIPRADGGDPISMKQAFSAQCFRHKSPDAFEVLSRAPIGAKVRISGHFLSRTANVPGDNGRTFTLKLGQMEITKAKVLQVLVDCDD